MCARANQASKHATSDTGGGGGEKLREVFTGVVQFARLLRRRVDGIIIHHIDDRLRSSTQTSHGDDGRILINMLMKSISLSVKYSLYNPEGKWRAVV